MIHLDTHLVAWLYGGYGEKFSPTAVELIDSNPLLVSPAALLELQYLFEIQRISADADTVLSDLRQRIGLQVDDRHFNAVVSQALEIPWTRDPFDRLIVAAASLTGSILLTKDQHILSHYQHARW